MRGYDKDFYGNYYLQQVWNFNIANQINECESIEWIWIFHSMAGGTGSGFTALLLEEMRSLLLKVNIISFTILPSAKMPSWIVEPLNFALGFMYHIDNTNFNIWYNIFNDICIRKKSIVRQWITL